MENRKKPLLLLLSLLLAASAAWAASPLSGPVAAPTPLATVPATPFTRTAPPLSLTLMLGFTCCALGVVLGIIVLGIVVNIEKRKAAQDDNPSKREPPAS